MVIIFSRKRAQYPMIPKDISDSDIQLAAREIDSHGVPKQRNSRKYLVQVGENLYPPKYIISLAVKHLRGQELDSLDFIATEARDYLAKRGYQIVTK